MRVNPNELVEMIIEKTEKGKFRWSEKSWGLEGRYKDIVAKLKTERWVELEVDGVIVDVDKWYKKRLQNAIEKQLEPTRKLENIKKREKEEGKLQKAYDILRG